MGKASFKWAVETVAQRCTCCDRVWVDGSEVVLCKCGADKTTEIAVFRTWADAAALAREIGHTVQPVAYF